MRQRNSRQTPRRRPWSLFTIGVLTAAALSAGYLHSAADEPRKVEAKAKNDLHGDPLPHGAIARLGTLRWRHAAAVNFVAFSPDGKEVITTSRDHERRRWDRETGKEVCRFVVTAPEKLDPAPKTQPGMPLGMMPVMGGGGATDATTLSKDGKILAVALSTGMIQMWDAGSGKEIRQIKGPRNIAALRFSPDGKKLAVRTFDRSTFVLEADSGKEIAQLKSRQLQQANVFLVGGPIDGQLVGVVFSPDGKFLATAETETIQQQTSNFVRISEADTGKEIRRLDATPTRVSAIGYSPGGKYLAYGTGNVLRQCEANTGKEIRRLDAKSNVEAVAFSPDDKTLAAKGTDRVTRLWETDTGKAMHELGEKAIAAPAAGNVIFLAGQATAEARDLAFSPDGKVVAAGGSQTVRMWDVKTGQELPLVGGHRGPVSATAITPDGKTLLSFGADKQIIRWELATGKELGHFQTPKGTTCVAFAPDGRTMVLSGSDGIIRVVATADGKEVLQRKGHANGTAAVAFSPDGKLLASRGGSDATVRIYDAANGNELKAMILPVPSNGGGLVFGTGGISVTGASLTFSPDGQSLAAHVASPVNNGMFRIQIQGEMAPVSEGDSLHVWDVATGKETRKIPLPAQRSVMQIGFSPDGRTIAAENLDQTISMWELSSGKERLQLGKASPRAQGGRPPFAPHPFAFAPGGGLLAMRNSDHSVRVLDTSSAKEIGGFKEHRGDVSAVEFSPDGKILVSGSRDTTILVWDASSLKRMPLPLVELESKEMETLWSDLASDDAAKAFRSILRLSAASKQTAVFLSDRLPSAAPVDGKKIDALLNDLNSEKFPVRNKAMIELTALSELAAPAMKKVLAGNPSLETRRRIEPMLEKVAAGVLTTEQLRQVRALEVLERIGTNEARQVLESLSQGAEGALMTRQAQAVLQRMNKAMASARR